MSFLPLDVVRPWVRYLSLWSLLLCIIGAIGPSPNYNAAVVIYLLIASYSESQTSITLLAVLLPLTLCTDMLWCVLHGDGGSSLGTYGLVLTIFLMILKVPLAVLVVAMFSSLGCDITCLYKVSESGEDKNGESANYSPPEVSDNSSSAKLSLREPLHDSSNTAAQA